uniref:cyclin-dependent kinase inhibitor 7-like n=1 Tax=Erigeron canadensis TaxID=72917 RepID=UPI001CB89B26|nr:cyclin-dependent kinase inhibitor 7-like [Erigeron canadensis]
MEFTYIGARTRARAKAMSRREETSDDDRENNSVSVVVKRRKLSSNYENQLKSPLLTLVQTNNACDRIYITATSALEEEQNDFSTNAASTSTTRSSGVEASCCSSTTTTRSSVHEELLNVSDVDKEERVEAETSTRNNLDRRIESDDSFFITSKIQFKTGSDKPESETTKKPSSLVKINSNASQLQAEKMPPEAELEEYFATVQQPLTKRFKDKYNYDIINDIPLEGRFEWIQVIKQGK